MKVDPHESVTVQATLVPLMKPSVSVKVVRRQPRMLRDAGQHARPNLDTIMKGEHKIRPSVAG